MENIVSTFEKLNEKARRIEEAMMILPNKYKFVDELNELAKSDKEVESLAVGMREYMSKRREILKKEYSKVMAQIQRVNAKMMFLLEHESLNPEASKENVPTANVQDTAAKADPDSVRLPMKKYSRSPLRSKRKVKLQFTDFEAEINEKDFNKIPSYMRGRIQIESLRDFLNNVLVRAFNEKYKLLYQEKSVINSHELALQNTFRHQADLFKDCNFITAEDLLRGRENVIATKDSKFIQMLRHLQIIRESRKGQVCAYIWKDKA